MRLIGEGRDSLVYDVGAGRVLRRYRRPQDTTIEARMMTWVGDHGVSDHLPVMAHLEATTTCF